MKKVIQESLHRWLIAALVSVAVLFMLQYGTQAALHMGVILAALIVWTVLMAAVDWILRPPAAAILLLLTATMTFVLCGGAPLIEYTVALYSGGITEPSLLADAVVLLEMAAVACAVWYALGAFWPRLAVSVCWCAYWIWAAFQELDLPKIALAAAASVVLYTLAEAIHRLRTRKGGEKGFAALAPTLMTLCAAAGALLMLLPTSPEPYGYPVLNAIWDKVEEFYEDTVTKIFYREEGDGEFTLDFAGYSDDAETGDGVSSSHGVSGAMLAKAQHNLDGMVYLVGNSWNTFDGRSWTSSISGNEDGLLDWNVDSAERIYALWRYQQEQEKPKGVTNYFKNTSIYLTYQDMRTRTLFTVPNATRITTDNKRFPWSSEPGKVLFDYLQTKDTYYRVYYLAQNRRFLPQLVAASEGYPYSAESELFWRTIFGEYRSEFALTLAVFDVNKRIEPLLAQRQELIESYYLSLPEDISTAVRDLAEEITRNCATDYDKLQAIADYLQENYTYNSQPEPVPEDVAFLDYVLFGSEEGYCTWYATAATMLARCVGIPARYVQGYCLDLEAGVLTAVEGSSSHAWCEGYIPGYGWITVEATPGFNAPDAIWGDVQEEEMTPEEELPAEEELPEDAGEVDGSNPGEIRYLSVILFAAAFGALSVVVWQQERIRRKYRSATWSGKAVLDLEAFLKAPAKREYKRQSSESLRQYFARLRWSLRLDPQEMDHMTELYEEVLFAERELTETEWKECRLFLAKLKKLRRKQVWSN